MQQGLIEGADRFKTVYDPIKVLQGFNRWCKAEAEILLFEHGVSSNKLLNWLLNKCDNWNLKKNGCHLNKDIKKIVLESGLIIEEIQSVILGTNYIIKAKSYKSDIDDNFIW